MHGQVFLLQFSEQILLGSLKLVNNGVNFLAGCAFVICRINEVSEQFPCFGCAEGTAEPVAELQPVLTAELRCIFCGLLREFGYSLLEFSVVALTLPPPDEAEASLISLGSTLGVSTVVLTSCVADLMSVSIEEAQSLMSLISEADWISPCSRN